MSMPWAAWYAWGQEWSPIIIGNTGTVVVPIYYPQNSTADAVLTVKGSDVHCLICGADIPKTKRRTKHGQFVLMEHLRAHGRRTHKQNKWVASALAKEMP